MNYQCSSHYRTSMVHEPLLLIAAFFIFFVLTIIYVRLDFAITKDESSEARMKLSGVSEKVLLHHVSYESFFLI